MINTTLSKWDAITWTLVLAIVPYGWTVIGALLMCWMVLQLGNRSQGKKKLTRRITHVDGEGIVTYGDITGYKAPVGSTRLEGNRETWRNFFDEEDF